MKWFYSAVFNLVDGPIIKTNQEMSGFHFYNGIHNFSSKSYRLLVIIKHTVFKLNNTTFVIG